MATDKLMVCFDGTFSDKEQRTVLKAIKRKLHNHGDVEDSRQKRSKEKEISSDYENNGKSEERNDSGRRELRCSNQTEAEDVSNYVSLDCEFVGVGPRKLNALGRCSIVNFNNEVLLDIYARPEEPITDYRTRWSGIKSKDMKKAVPFEFAQSTILNVIKDKILVGHALFNDLSVLKIHHPAGDIRDTAKCSLLKTLAGFSANGSDVGLKKLSSILLERKIQSRRHCSIEDANASMDLFKLFRSKGLKSNMHSEFYNHYPCTSQSKGCCERNINSTIVNKQHNGLHNGRVQSQTLKYRHQRWLSLDQHPYFKDEFWPTDLNHH